MRELKELLVDIRDNNEIKPEIYFINKKTYDVFRMDAKEEFAVNTKANILTKLLEDLSGKDIITYDPLLPGENAVEKLEVKEVTKYVEELRNKIYTPEGEKIDNEELKTEINNISFVAIKFIVKCEDGKDKEVTLFVKFIRTKYMNEDKPKFSIVDNEFDLVYRPVYTIDNTVFAIEYNDMFYILKRKQFESTFKFDELYTMIIEASKENIESLDVIDNVSEMLERAKHDGRYKRRVVKAIKDKDFEVLAKHKDKIAEIVERHHKDVLVVDGKLIYDEDSIRDIMQILSRSFVTCELTGESRVAKGFAKEEE